MIVIDSLEKDIAAFGIGGFRYFCVHCHMEKQS